jgi:uncharacterized protein (TIGR00369 family)
VVIRAVIREGRVAIAVSCNRKLADISCFEIVMPASPDPNAPSDFAQHLAKMVVETPFCAALGMQLLEFSKGRVLVKMPYRPALAGNADGVISGGAVTSLLDNALGAAAGLALSAPAFVATINLRIDYMRAASPGLDLIAEGECYKLTRHVAFVRGLAFERDRADPVAHCVAAFMINPIPPDIAAAQSHA